MFAYYCFTAIVQCSSGFKNMCGLADNFSKWQRLAYTVSEQCSELKQAR
jgi:hypothetical protein